MQLRAICNTKLSGPMHHNGWVAALQSIQANLLTLA